MNSHLTEIEESKSLTLRETQETFSNTANIIRSYGLSEDGKSSMEDVETRKTIVKRKEGNRRGSSAGGRGENARDTVNKVGNRIEDKAPDKKRWI